MAGRIRFDDFESYPLGQMTLPTANGFWGRDGARPAPTIVSSAIDGGVGPRSGTKMARHNFNTLVSDSTQFDVLVTTNLDTLPINDELFYRTWVRFDADHGVSNLSTNPSPMKFFRLYNNQGNLSNDLYETLTVTSFGNAGLAYSGSTGNLISLVTYFGFGIAPDPNSTTLSFSQWIKIEFYLKLSTGQIRVWQNGHMVRNDSGLNLNHWGTHGVGWLDFHTVSNWGDVENNGYTHGTQNHLYVDDFEVFSDTGTGGTGLMSDASIQQSSGGDVTPPTDPSSLIATAISTSRIDLSWTASTDAVGVTNYLVERALGAGSFSQVGTSGITTFSSTGLAESASYRHRVRATDAAGNLSGYSNITTTSTLSVPPAAPTGVTVT